MPVVAPDTRVRASVAEAGSLAFAGDPASVHLRYLSDGTETDAPRIEPRRAPDLVEAVWEMDGAEVSAYIEVVAVRYCTLESILAYRADQYRLSKSYDKESPELWEARARAEQVIEREAMRRMQPVMALGFIDRPSCMTRTLVIGDGGYDPDLISLVSASGPDGEDWGIRQVRKGSPYIDNHLMPYGSSAEAVYVTGLRQTPAEMADAVRALAAWYLVPRTGPDNATSTSTEAGVLNYVIGGVDGAATSLPEVNALISRYGRRDPRVV